MRIGVNALYLVPGGVGGTEVYLRNLLAGLARIDTENRYVVFTNRETGCDLVPARPNFQCSQQPVDAANRPRRLIYEQTRLPRAMQADVLLNPGFTAPFWPGCPQVTVFHDLQHKQHPEHFKTLDLLAWRFFLYCSAKRSDALIAVSEATRRDLLSEYRVHAARVHTVPHGVEDAFFEIADQRRPEPLVLYVSTLHPHKNHERLLNAFARFRASFPEYRLVLAGMRGFHATQVEQAVERLRLREHVEVTGWVSRERLLELYRRAAIAVYPSTFEGFGMPVLEAMAAGVPLACSRIEPLASNAGDAALYFDPADERQMADSLCVLALDEAVRAKLISAGRRRAQGRTWDAAAERTLEVLRSVSRTPRP